MSNLIESLRAFAQGTINESALKSQIEPDEGYDFENNEEFIQECMNACLPTMLQMDIMGESADQLDESVVQAYVTLQNYLLGQGVISEAATVSLNNPKITVVRMGKEAQLNRLASIITLKMARKDKSKNYTKYKLGSKIKKENMAAMKSRYYEKAKRLAKKLIKRNKAKGKVAAVVNSEKAKVSSK